MYYVYVLRDKISNTPYIDKTNNLEQSLKQHQTANKNIELVYYEAYKEEKMARNRENTLNTHGSAWEGLRRRLKIF